MADILKMTVPGKPEYVSTVRMAAAAFALSAGFDVEEIEDIKVAISEVCMNLILHGDEPGVFEQLHPDVTSYEVHFEIDKDELSIYVEDHGIGYDPETEAYSASGDVKTVSLGVFIVKALMDEVEIRAKADLVDPGICVCMKKHRHPDYPEYEDIL